MTRFYNSCRKTSNEAAECIIDDVQLKFFDKSTFVYALRKRARVLRPAGKSGQGTFREQTFLIK